MSGITRTKRVKAGDWRTLESGWNASFSCQFFLPAGAKVKLRKGVGWLGWNSQEKTLDGVTPKVINVGGVVYSRVQIKVKQDIDVSYLYVPIGP
jgi:hypothetical protein